MSQSRLFVVLTTVVVTSVSGRAETPDKHIRVILDTSQSLRRNDPSGYVKLASAMFYDLALETLNPRDSFKLALFKPDWQDWKKTGQAPSPITPNLVMEPRRDPAGRAQFVGQMQGLRYDSQQTYFSPSFQWGLEDLRSSRTSIKDNRVIVLITDGVPDWKEEDGKALTALVPQLRDEHIQVYVLAFSKEILDNSGWFRAILRFGQSDGVSGDVKERADANFLLSDMLEIFGRSFGYSREQLGSSPTQIDVAANSTLERAAVVALYQQAGQPGFELNPPSGPAMPQRQHETGSPDPQGQGEKRPLSYAYQWLVPPLKGNYGFRTTGSPASEVAVLRPIHVEAVVRGRNNGPSVSAVMADKPAEMEVLVRPTAGGSGDPGKDIRVGFYLHYFDKDNSSDPKLYPSEEGEGQLTNEGRVFVIKPQFVRNPPKWEPETRYPGYIEVVVQQFTVPVERAGARMYPVQVYPYRSIRPTPPEATAEASGHELLRSGEEGCVRFQFQEDQNSRPESGDTMGVRLNPPLKLDGPLRGAKVRLDDRDLDGLVTGALWQIRLPFRSGSEKHTFCILVGHPTQAAALNVQVHFGLLKDSDQFYQQLNVVYPDLTVHVNIAAPSFWYSFSPWLILLLSLLLTYLLGLFWKSRRTLAPDLTVSLGDGSPALTAAQLGELSIASRWLGFPQDRPVISLTGDKEIGSVRPLDGELFAFVPRSGFGNLCKKEGGDWRPLEPRGDGSWLVSAGEVYRAGVGPDARFFRLDYSVERPRV